MQSVRRRFPAFPRSSMSQHEKQIQSQLRVAPSTIPNAGRGVFAVSRIPKNTRLGYYRGSIVPNHELRRRYNNSSTVYTYSLIVSDRRGGKTFSVDNSMPEDGDCILRYINDARSSKKNNCEFSWYGDVYTLRDINKGEELFISYGNDYWKGFNQ